MALVSTAHIKTIDDVRRVLQKLASNKMGPNATPTYVNIILTGLATGLLHIDGDGNITACVYVPEYGAFEVGS